MQYKYCITAWDDQGGCNIYIGISNNIQKRWNQHQRNLTLGKHHNTNLQKLFDSGKHLYYDQLLDFDHLTEYEAIRYFLGRPGYRVMNIASGIKTDPKKSSKKLPDPSLNPEEKEGLKKMRKRLNKFMDKAEDYYQQMGREEELKKIYSDALKQPFLSSI